MFFQTLRNNRLRTILKIKNFSLTIFFCLSTRLHTIYVFSLNRLPSEPTVKINGIAHTDTDAMETKTRRSGWK